MTGKNKTDNQAEPQWRSRLFVFIPAVALCAFLLDVADSLLRAKGFFEIAGKGWQQVDLVGRRVDLKPCEPKEKAEMVFISKIGPAIIRPLTAAWQQHFGEPMPLKN